MKLQSTSTDDDLEEISANADQVKKHMMTNLKMFLKRKGKDEKKKRGECKAEIHLKLVRRLRFSCDSTKLAEMFSFSSIQPTFGRVSTPKRASRGLSASPRSPRTFPTPSSTT